MRQPAQQVRTVLRYPPVVVRQPIHHFHTSFRAINMFTSRIPTAWAPHLKPVCHTTARACAASVACTYHASDTISPRRVLHSAARSCTQIFSLSVAVRSASADTSCPHAHAPQHHPRHPRCRTAHHASRHARQPHCVRPQLLSDPHSCHSYTWASRVSFW